MERSRNVCNDRVHFHRKQIWFGNSFPFRMLTRLQRKKAVTNRTKKTWSLVSSSDAMDCVVSFLYQSEYKRAKEVSKAFMRKDLFKKMFVLKPSMYYPYAIQKPTSGVMLRFFHSRPTYTVIDLSWSVCATDELVSHILENSQGYLTVLNVCMCPNLTVLPELSGHDATITEDFELILKPQNSMEKGITLKLSGNVRLFKPEHHVFLGQKAILNLFLSAILVYPFTFGYDAAVQFWNDDLRTLKEYSSELGYLSPLFDQVKTARFFQEGTNDPNEYCYVRTIDDTHIEFHFKKVPRSDGTSVLKIDDIVSSHTDVSTTDIRLVLETLVQFEPL